jgi:hypothetical protein
MNGYITSSRFNSVLNAPISLPQTELRRGRYIIAGQVKVTLGQVLRVRGFVLHLLALLTPDAQPDIFNTALGLISASINPSQMICSGPLRIGATSPGAVSFNSFSYKDFAAPGVYYWIVSNNTTNVDVTVALSGVAQILNFG